MNTKTTLWVIGITLIGCAISIGCVSHVYHETVSMGTGAPVMEPAGGSDQPFYEDLAPHGRWVSVSGPGWVWSPYNVEAAWRPYQLGHWVYTDYGWTWASDEEWGWAVYHYGRWHLDASYGWVWVPGTEWGPAWVAWHEGGGYVGWAPLPWQVSVHAGAVINWSSVNVSIAPASWCFVNARHLVNPGLRNHIVPATRNVTLVQVTKNVTNYTYIDNRVINGGVKVEKIGRAAGHTIPRYRVADTDLLDVPHGGKVRGQDFVVFRNDPVRGRKSQGRPVPPGHDGTVTTPKPPAPPAPPNTPETSRLHEPRQSRSRKVLDEMMGRKTAPRPPSKPAPPDTATTTSPAETGPARPGTASRPAETGPANTATGGGQQGANTPPAKPRPTNAQTAREKAKEARDAASKGKKPKREAPKPDDSATEESNEEKPAPEQ